MITSSSISYVSQMLDEPQNINDADAESIRLLTEAYPYFVPARYMQAAQQHKLETFTPEMMSTMQLFSGNWLMYNEYLETALDGKEALYEPAAEVVPEKAAVPEIAEDELPEEEEEIEEEIVIAEPATPVEAFVAEQEAKDIIVTTEEPIIEAEEEEVVAAEDDTEIDDFVLKNTGFIRGRMHDKPTPAAEEEPPTEEPAAEDKPDVSTPQSEKTARRQARQAEWDDKSENLIAPIYTEDYFRHMGMPVSNDIPTELNKSETPQDDSGQDKSLMVVMSFSEWLMFYKKKKQQEQEEVKDQKELRSMWQKEKLAAAMEEENEEIPENVFEMAVNSITKEENLISESLAEVMVKQGRYDRAIDMYKKLSLRKPQKKAYFARKIEEILKEK